MPTVQAFRSLIVPSTAMHGSKLHHLLESLAPREMRRFVDFVHSPYYNKHERLQALVDYRIYWSAMRCSSTCSPARNSTNSAWPT
jgi:hypothetical protein